MDALPRVKAASVELCSLDSLLRTVKGGTPAWFGLIRSNSSLTTMEVEQGPGVGETAAPKSRWDKLCDRFPTLF